jgi:DNA-binding protein H-NS
MANLKELLAQKAEIEKAIETAKRQGKADAIAKVRGLMAELDVSLEDLKSRGKVEGKPTAKVAPKYRNAATGDTWSGRGLKPKWLTAALATGKKLEDFAI